MEKDDRKMKNHPDKSEVTPKKLDGLNIIRFEKEFGIVPGSFLLSGI